MKVAETDASSVPSCSAGRMTQHPCDLSFVRLKMPTAVLLRKLTEPLTPDPLMVYLTPFCHRWKYPHSSSKPHRFHSNKPLDVMTHISFVSTEMSLAVVWKAQRELGRLIVAADASYYPQLVQHWLGIFIVFDNTNKKHDVVGAEERRL